MSSDSVKELFPSAFEVSTNSFLQENQKTINLLTIPSKSVTKVQNLPKVSYWNDETAILRDYVRCFFTKKRRILRLNQSLSTRKRVIILTPEDKILIYETNCTGYVFPIRDALKLKTSSSVIPNHLIEKSCTLTLKYSFGSINIILINQQISIWRRILSTIYEGDHFDNSLTTDISLYTARDDDDDDKELDEDDTLYEATRSEGSNFEYTDTAVSLKSAHGFMNLSSSATVHTDDASEMRTAVADDLTNDALVETAETNSSRSLTYLPQSAVKSERSKSRQSSKSHNMVTPFLSSLNDSSSVRRGAKCVSYLAKRFEGKLKEGFQRTIGGENNKKLGSTPMPKAASPPLEILFPPLPVRKLNEEDAQSLIEKQNVEITKLEYTPTKMEKKSSYWL